MGPDLLSNFDMEHPGFFQRASALPTEALALKTNSTLNDRCPGVGEILIHDVSSLDVATHGHVSFFDNPKYLDQFTATTASACFVHPKHVAKAPHGVVTLTTNDPYRAFAKALWLYYPDAGQSKIAAASKEPQHGITIDSTARLEDGVIVESNAVIGPEAQIGAGTRIAAGAVVGYRCCIGRNCYIGPRAVITHALIGNNVIIHAGAAIGQDGFGFAMGPSGHFKVPQIGRVIIQDHVEIGANTTIDRGALRDTVIGEGTKIDNLVQIAHNVRIGRHCVIVAQVGIAGSTELEDFVVMAGQSAAGGHLRIGAGAQIAAQSGVIENIPRGARWGGSPAQPLLLWARELALMKRLARRKNA